MTSSGLADSLILVGFTFFFDTDKVPKNGSRSIADIENVSIAFCGLGLNATSKACSETCGSSGPIPFTIL